MTVPSLCDIYLKALYLMRDMDWYQDTEWYLCEGGLEFSTDIQEFLRGKRDYEKERERDAGNSFNPYDYINGSLLTDDDESSNDSSTATRSSKSSPAPNNGMFPLRLCLIDVNCLAFGIG